MTLFDLNNKRAIVVGGSGDFGLAAVSALLEAGAGKVVVIDKDDLSGDMKDNYPTQVDYIKTDISIVEDARRAYFEALNLLGGEVDILVNTAGIQRRYPADEFPLKEWSAVLDVNLTAVFLFTQLAVNSMKTRCGGKIINVGSIMSFLGGSNIVAYAAAKGGVAQLSRSFCNDTAKYGININTIIPGYFKTKLNVDLFRNRERMDEINKRLPQGRWGIPEDLRGVIIFLASKASDYINGETIAIDGGYSVR